MKVKFETSIINDQYRYGDLNRKPYKYYSGYGEILSYLTVKDEVKCIVKTDDDKIIALFLSEVEVR